LSLKGDLAIDSGYYDSYKSTHWQNYFTQTIAHNSLVFSDVNGNMINQEIRHAPKSFSEVLSGQFVAGGISAFTDQPSYSYALGNGAQAYAPGLLNQFKRHFVFLKQDSVLQWPVIVVYD